MTHKLNKVIGLGLAVLTVTGGAAFAASTTGNLTVYSGPSDTSTLVGEIKGDQTFNIVKRSGEWCEITSPKAGWVSCAQLDVGSRTNLARPSLGMSTDVTAAPIWDPHSDTNIADRQNP
jgi:uncharacterized protein YraI